MRKPCEIVVGFFFLTFYFGNFFRVLQVLRVFKIQGQAGRKLEELTVILKVLGIPSGVPVYMI